MPIRFLPEQASPQVRAEQIRLLYDHGPTLQLLSIATGMVAVAMFWAVANHAMLLLWIGVLVVDTLTRVRFYALFAARKPSGEDALKRWANLYVAHAFVSGLVWGSLCLFYDASWPAPYQVILFVIYTGVIAGTFNINTPHFISFPAFYLPLVGWLCLTLLQQKGEGFYALAALFAFYILFMYVSALKFHNSLSHSLAIRFENERLANELAVSNQRLASLADTDELTNLANRRSMFKCLKSEWNRHYRTKTPFSLMYVDLDFFKQYNDSYGHAGGDHCLINIAQLLRNHALRSSDMAARFGGEEFALILPNTAHADAMTIAASILRDLERMHIPHAASMYRYVTASIGIASMVPDQPDNDAALREAADQALYRAKHAGRNRIESAPFSQQPTSSQAIT